MKKILILMVLLLTITSCGSVYHVLDKPYTVKYAGLVNNKEGKYKYWMEYKDHRFIYCSDTLYQVGQVLFMRY